MSKSIDEMTADEMQAEISRLKSIIAKAKAVKAGGLSVRKSPKGGVSVYGLGRFPVTLYPEQWKKLLSAETSKTILDFIADNRAELSWKGEGGTEAEPADATTSGPAAPEPAAAF